MNKSCFAIDTKKAYGMLLAIFFGSLFSFLALYPIFAYRYKKYCIDNTYIDGRRLTFTAEMPQFYFQYAIGYSVVIVLFYCVNRLIDIAAITHLFTFRATGNTIAAFLSSFFLTRRVKIFIQEHTHFADSCADNSYYRFNLFNFVLYTVATKVLNSLSIGLFYPTMKSISERYEASRKVIDGRTLTYTVKRPYFILRWAGQFFMCIVTVGLYVPILIVSIRRWLCRNIHIAPMPSLLLDSAQ